MNLKQFTGSNCVVFRCCTEECVVNLIEDQGLDREAQTFFCFFSVSPAPLTMHTPTSLAGFELHIRPIVYSVSEGSVILLWGCQPPSAGRCSF